MRRFALTGFDIGRIALASLFVLGGLNKIFDASATTTRMFEAGIPWPALTIIVVVVVELGAGLIVAAGAWFRNARFVPMSAFLLIMHTGLINLIFHPFWLFVDAEAATELSLFFKNISVMGGLALLVSLHSPKGAVRMIP